MSDLLSLLHLGSAAIAAQNTGVATAGNNISNANTAGYSRQRVDLEELQGSPYIGGVRSLGTTRLADSLLGGRILQNNGSLAMSTAFSDALTDMEARLTTGGATIDEQLSTLYSRLSQVSAMPTDTNLRDSVVAAARDLVAGIHRRAAEVQAARREADTRIRDNATQATKLAAELAKANKDVGASSDPALLDRRDQLAGALAKLVGGGARVDSDGQMRFVLDGGAVLVDGTHAAQLAATTDPATTYAKLEVVDGGNRRDVTAQLGGGAIGGDLTFRDQTTSRISSQLDQLAYDITQGFNAVHTANAGLDGTSGRVMFTPLGTVAGAAAAMELDPALAADSKRLATSAAGSGPGDNRGALALFNLSRANIASGGTRTPTDAALDIVSALALETSGAKEDVSRDQTVSGHLAGLRDSISGVDTQEELTNLARFEHVSSALGKFLSTVDDMLAELITRL
jgi:flagellar hook-associated protein 1 FlgK